MPNGKRFIGFDIGAESGRCVVGHVKNKHMSLTEVHRFTTPVIYYGGHYFWDILAIYQQLLTGLTHAKEQFGSQFDGIGVDTWGVDYVLLDGENRLLGYPYHYRDSRTDGIFDKAFKIVSKADIYRNTGIQFIQFNTLYQLLTERDRALNLVNIADQMLLTPDYLLFLLSGVKRGEYTIVSTTSMADPFKRDWNWDLIKSFDLPARIFPRVVEPGSQLGSLLPEVAQITGISKETPVIAGANHDTGAAVASIPARKGDWAFLSSGTWSLMGVELSEPLIDDSTLEYNFTNEGGVGKTIRFLKNIIGLWPVQECRRSWAEAVKEYEYDELADLALKQGPVNTWFNVDDPRFLKAGEMPGKIISLLKETGQPFQDNPGWITRCVLESLAFKYRATIEEIKKVTGKELKCLHAVGGGIQNKVLNQLTADAIGMGVIAGPVEGTIVGNIGMQAISTGAISDLQELREIVSNSFKLEIYHPQNPQYFDENEKLFWDIVRSR